MKTTLPAPQVKRLVLVGGGHSHLEVLKRFGMKPLPGLDLILITREPVQPYSGMLPGHVNGSYRIHDIRMDLRPLAQFAGARIIQAEVSDIDLEARVVHVSGRPPLPFDILSLNVGARSAAADIAGAERHAIAVKPIELFISRWNAMRKRARAILREREFRLLVVGGGPASVELALAARAMLNNANRDLDHPASVALATMDREVLAGHNRKSRRRAARTLTGHGIEIFSGFRVTAVREGEVEGLAVDGNRAQAADSAPQALAADAVLLATGAAAESWPAACGLAVSDDGYIEVNRHLQSTSHPFVFAAGDNALIRGRPTPRNGVHAVRQGKPLARNLRQFALDRRLTKHTPRKHTLAILNLSDGTAEAMYGWFSYRGRLALALKQFIDRRYLRRLASLPEPEAAVDLAPGLADDRTAEELRLHGIRCAGCAAKLAGDALGEALQVLRAQECPDLLPALGAAEDAAVIRLHDGRAAVQSVDQLKAFVNDPWLFARIATNHCLGDLHAMGAMPHSALAVVGLPYASAAIMRDTLAELMHGCQTELQGAGGVLAGGHTAETSDLLFGLSVTGFANESELLPKRGLRADTALILTKPLGTGTLLAADMRCRARHEWLAAAIAGMLLSNGRAGAVLAAHGAVACTDVTGFGLAGHLLEMLPTRELAAKLRLQAIPVLPGALECMELGIVSSLHAGNRRSTWELMKERPADALDESDPRLAMLFDPQTAGGLLGGVPRDRAAACVAALRDAGYAHAAIIGHIRSADPDNPPVEIMCGE